jgi:hypothetical protein
LNTRPHFLDKDLYLRLVIPPGYFISELIRDKWPSEHSAIGVGISGGLWADSQVEFRDARFKEKEETAWAGGLRHYLPGHHLPRNNLGGVGTSLSIALTKRIMLVVGYGYGI